MSERESGGGGGTSSSPAGFVGAIPPGLNRIRTRRASSRPEELTEPKNYGASRPPPVKSKKNDQKTVAASPGRGRTVSSSSTSTSSKGAGQQYKGKKISRWLASYFSPADKNNNNNSKLANDAPANNEERKMVADAESKSSFEGNGHTDRQQSSQDTSTSRGRTPKCIKSFSHELGPRGGIAPSPPRAHSYSDLTELLGSLCSRYDAAKEIATQELASFARDVMDVLEQMHPSMQEDRRMAEDLLILAEMCVEMAETQFRVKCETIVQDLTERRRKCHTGVLKWLFTRMLFILTRCTRLLQFQKDGEPIDENSLHNFKKCLDSVPSVEMSWETHHRITDSHPDRTEEIAKNDNLAYENKFPYKKLENEPLVHMRDSHQADNRLISSFTCGLLHEQGRSPDDTLHDQGQLLDESNSALCRICEEIVPICHLESHSYICAYADKCDQTCLDLDDRLSNLEEMLEQIVESRNMNVLPSHVSHEIMRMQSASNAMTEGYSPKISEWRNKGVEGMFEDIHDMDTAFIDDAPLLPVNLKGHLGIKLSNNYGTSSSTGSITSVSSTNTPKTGHFDTFWLTLNNPSEQEDVQQMIDLADIARCVANVDLSTEGSHEFLLACMQDLQDILQNSRLKALVIDTFGARVEKLLREKYMNACNLMDVRIPASDGNLKDNSTLLLDIAPQNSAASTPLHSSHRERTSIDDFEIIKPISRGAFGKVFLARKYTTGDLFAIKVLKKLDMLRKNHAQRILAERNILITVRNPFVVRFYYSFTCRDNLYLVMEYLSGGDLYSMLRKVGCLEEEVARVYIAELVLALEYLHSLGIVHRDLKPDNILIAHDGHIKLTDFGLSKIGLMNCAIDLSGQEMSPNMSSDAVHHDPQEAKGGSCNSAVGTPDYLAPEILLGTEHGYAADWWSVGIILFELITGVPPFNAEHPEVVFDNILNNKIPWPPVPDYMSHEAQDFINRLLIHEPNERLGANGSMEVKSHPFFRGIDWDNLALQKAAFVPSLDGADDTSYFVSRYSQIHSRKTNNRDNSNSDTDTYGSSPDSEAEVDECGDLEEFNSSSPLDLSMLNFSFKNLSQLASINHDVLLQNAKDPTNCSPSRAPDT